MTALLQVEHLAASYGRVQAVRDVTLQVNEDEVVAIIGPNGAGKSSLLNAIAGLLPSRGAMTFAGTPLVGRPAEDTVRLG
ncbi:MAG: ATP-binding cassette domain-containing protein, partial [Dehalococcoidia bacterium]|nr:ATP-binding cassette domain-containing protein [Dehalococcoidia bacterium]